MEKVTPLNPQQHLLGELVVEMGFINRSELTAALRRQEEELPSPILSVSSPAELVVAKARRTAVRKPRLGEVLIGLGLMNEEQIKEALKKQNQYFQLYFDLPPDVLRTLMEIGIAVNSGMNPAELLELILGAANRLLTAEASSIMLLDHDTGELVLSVPSGPKADSLTDVRVPAGKGVGGWVAAHREPLVVNDVSDDERFFSGIDQQSGFETKSIICVPMINRGNLSGVIEVINKENNAFFSGQDQLVLSRLADQAAVVVENARIYHELHNRMDQLLLREKEKYRNLLDTLTVAVVSVDSEGDVVYVNPCVSVLTGQPERDFIGRSFAACFGFYNPDGSRVVPADLIENCRAVPGELLLQCRDGSTRWVSVTIAPLDSGPNKDGFQSIIQDISREKEIRNRLVQDQQLSSTGMLAGSVAYEINTPLQGIASVLDLIRTRYPEEKWLLERVWDLDKTFVGIRDIVKKLSDLSHSGAEQPQMISLNRPVEEATSLLRSYLQRDGVSLRLKLDPTLPPARLSPAMVSQAMTCMLTNAVEAMHPEHHPREVLVTTSHRQDRLLLTVEDSGPGIPTSHLGDVFDTSFSTKYDSGPGVGLAVCRAVAERHGGTIVAENSLLGGAKFEIRFPLKQELS